MIPLLLQVVELYSAIGKGDNVHDAQRDAYEKVSQIQSDHLFYRHDIANKALQLK